MPVEAKFPKASPPQPSATIGDAVTYVAENPGGVTYVVNAVKWLIGLVGAFLKPPMK
jgi:hypothetical protein